MSIVVINGTQVRGCTHRIKEAFLSPLRSGSHVTEFELPRDLPHFCTGCKRCFFEDEALCPHAEHTMPIWKAMLEADLLVLAAPVYALRTTAQMKALLDHLCCHWMVHRPHVRMFSKRAVILTNSIGASNRAAQSDIKTSLNWLGVSHVRRLGFGLMEGAVWEALSQKRREKIVGRVQRLAGRYTHVEPAAMGLRVKLYFALSRVMHRIVLKNEAVPSADNRYWIAQGWLNKP